jgi:hypothetical protein
VYPSWLVWAAATVMRHRLSDSRFYDETSRPLHEDDHVDGYDGDYVGGYEQATK